MSVCSFVRLVHDILHERTLPIMMCFVYGRKLDHYDVICQEMHNNEQRTLQYTSTETTQHPDGKYTRVRLYFSFARFRNRLLYFLPLE